MSRLRVVTVVGSSVGNLRQLTMAENLGRMIKRQGWSLACGGKAGVMEAACRGFQAEEGPGVSIGILPGIGRADGNPYCDVLIPTGLGLARNHVVILAGHVVVIIGGESASLSELAFAWQHAKPMIALEPAGGVGAQYAGKALDKRHPNTIFSAASVEAVIARIEQVFDQGLAI